MSVKKMPVAIVGLLLGLGLAQAHAEAPNYYECHGKDISLKFYDHSYVNGTTLFNLNLDKKSYSVNDDANIETQATVMGDVKSITTKILPDVSVKKASFIIPTINLGVNVAGDLISNVNFKSKLIVTTIATPFISNVYIGVVNTSKYYDLSCKASLVFIPL